jgi:hypothetical protein
MMTGLSEDEYRFYHYQPAVYTTIDCDTSDDEEDNAFQQTTCSTWPPEVVVVKEPSQAQGSQSQANIKMTTDTIMIDGGVSSYASSNSNNKRDISSLQLSASSSSDLSVAMTGGTNNKNVRTSYVPHMRTRATWNTDLVCITGIINIPSMYLIIIIISSTTMIYDDAGDRWSSYHLS